MFLTPLACVFADSNYGSGKGWFTRVAEAGGEFDLVGVHIAANHHTVRILPQDTQIGNICVSQVVAIPNLALVEKVLHESSL